MKNNRTISPAGSLLKKLTRSNKAILKRCEAYDVAFIPLQSEEAIVVSFIESLVSLFNRYGDILEALSTPQENIVIIEEEEEE